MDITKTDEKTAETAPEPKTEGSSEVEAATGATVERDAQDTQAEPAEPADDASDDDSLDDDSLDDELAAEASTGVGAGGAAVVSAALGAVALTGTWTGKVVSERETLMGQISSQSAPPAQQISEIYGDAWHSTALVNGVFALLALVTAVLVLVLARPDRPVWVRAVALAGAVLGGLGLLLSVGTYFDLFLSLPTTGS
ncbi:hypothetical protein AQF52_5606 [Streptomyces venezuelae]|uniref:hypothetical protein n=1 Tax=Streptomyces gardneri TaxID=66892 RepID=UPI0006E29567|nr:hypothetical protein [Streptomyces gardneri]ALO11200.1 hypothetical protein AQF52_5606 [Streptomyces venezuelae]QPK48129.1 hypothetical protein H4W23_28135 [Streptomyces gardneri]WRK39587.1 hypothetical protein U0M97_28260 [Streptomyces venezuelae]